MALGNQFLWAVERDKAKSSAAVALKKVKDKEKKLLKAGWRWVSVTPKFKIFVPCDKNGKPTKEGKRKIEEMTQNLYGV